jgi:hypothetical protein
MIFSTVTNFQEKVGRRQVWKYAELDNMLCVYTGPNSLALDFKPLINSPHPSYPLMFCTDSQITTLDAGVAEVQVTYAGIIQTSGTSSYVTPPITSESAVQGSRDFQRTFVSLKTPAIAGTGTGAGTIIPANYDYGTETLAVRYIGVQCSVRYLAYPRPTSLKYSSLGKSRVTWSILSQTIGPRTVVASGVLYEVAQAAISSMAIPPVPSLFAAYLGSQLEQRGKWFECSEIYGPSF